MNDVVATLLDRYKAKCDDYNAQRAQYEAKYAECTRLKAERDKARRDYERLLLELRDARAENKRLQAIEKADGGWCE